MEKLKVVEGIQVLSYGVPMEAPPGDRWVAVLHSKLPTREEYAALKGLADAYEQLQQQLNEAVEALRPEVRQFAALMERNLAAHDDRPGWKGDRWDWLWARLVEEAGELHTALVNGESSERIASEAADVANFCMMIADVCGGLAVHAIVTQAERGQAQEVQE